LGCPRRVWFTPDSDQTGARLVVRFVPILLQKSKVASVRIFGETLRREAIDDSDNHSRVTEVAYEFSLRRWGPSDLYTKTAPAALRIFDTFGKTTFATLSATNGRLVRDPSAADLPSMA
jgi:hypothetical protein